MKSYIERRVLDEAMYIVENEATVRDTADVFRISKSTVHKDMSERLPGISAGIYRDVKAIFDKNLDERHLRGGIATKNKYARIRDEGERSGQ